MFKIKLSSLQRNIDKGINEAVGLAFTMNLSSLDQFKEVVLENVEHLKQNETILIEVTKL